MKLRVDPANDSRDRHSKKLHAKQSKLAKLSDVDFYVLLEMWELLTSQTVEGVDYRRASSRLQEFKRWSDKQPVIDALVNELRERTDGQLERMDQSGTYISPGVEDMVYARLHRITGDIPVRLVRLRTTVRNQATDVMGAGTGPAPKSVA